MSAYSTKTINREEAVKLILACRYKRPVVLNPFEISNQELEDELNSYAYSEEYEDILGVLYNFDVVD